MFKHLKRWLHAKQKQSQLGASKSKEGFYGKGFLKSYEPVQKALDQDYLKKVNRHIFTEKEIQEALKKAKAFAALEAKKASVDGVFNIHPHKRLSKVHGNSYGRKVRDVSKKLPF